MPLHSTPSPPLHSTADSPNPCFEQRGRSGIRPVPTFHGVSRRSICYRILPRRFGSHPCSNLTLLLYAATFPCHKANSTRAEVGRRAEIGTKTQSVASALYCVLAQSGAMDSERLGRLDAKPVVESSLSLSRSRDHVHWPRVIWEERSTGGAKVFQKRTVMMSHNETRVELRHRLRSEIAHHTLSRAGTCIVDGTFFETPSCAEVERVLSHLRTWHVKLQQVATEEARSNTR